MKKRNRAAKLLRLKVISLAVASCFSADLAFANPTGPVVANGQVSIIQNGNLLQITNSPNSIINWQNFSIGTNEITRFLQQSNSSAVLNRVITQNPSAILGALQSNGRVFLINPNGILFGAGAQVDVAGLVASSLRLSDADFLAGRLRFMEVPGAGSVINQGAINTAQGGQVYLVGPAVTNSGIITSPKGEVILAAGNSVELVSPGTPNLRVEITAPDNQAINLGQIVADAGRVGIYAGLINQSGTIRANSAMVTEDGRIVLKATKGVTLEAGSVTQASGPQGGSISLETETGTVRVAGQLDATGTEAGGAINISVTGATGGIDLATGLNSGNASVSVNGPGSTTILNADIITDAANIMINDSVELGGPALITLDTTNGGAFPGGANITITGTTNDIATPSGLVLRAGTSGTNTLGGAVGDTTAIASLMTSGNTTAINGGLVNTTGNQTYNGPVTLGTATTLAATGPTANIAINNSLTGIANSLTMNAGRDITIGGNVFSGAQTISATGDITVAATGVNSVSVSATGPQSIIAGGTLTVQGGAGTGLSAQVLSSAGQTISASSINVTGGSVGNSSFAEILQTGPGAGQGITIDNGGAITLQGGPSGTNNFVRIRNDGTGMQTISGSPTITITGGTGGLADQGNNASILAAGPQVITAGNTTLTAGASGFSNFATIGSPDQDITIHGNLTLTGGGSLVGVNASADARIGGRAGAASTPTNLTLTVHGDVFMNGGTATNAGATIGNSFQGGQPTAITMDVTGNITLGTGTMAGSSARIGPSLTNPAGGNISIAADGNITLDNATVTSTRSVIRTLDSLTLDAHNITVGGSVISGAQTIHATGDITVAAPNAVNALMTATGPQSITAGGTLTVQGGTGTGLSASITGSGGQTINASSINVTGGSVGNSSFAEIRQTGATGSQSVDASIITITGGASGANNVARIRNDGTGVQTITGSPVITLTGGTGGALDQGNFAQIRAAGPQTITAGATSITAGESGVNNFASIQSPTQAITVQGDLTLTGGGSTSSTVTDGAARIGGLGGAVTTPTNLTLTVEGDVAMTGGTMANAGAVIGSGFTGAQTTAITMIVDGNVSLNPGTVAFAGSRIGSPSAGPAGGNISVKAGGDIVMNTSPGLQGSVIRTTGSVALQAKAITQGAGTVIQAGSLTTSTANGASLPGANQVSSFNATNMTSGPVTLNNASSLLTVNGVSQVPTEPLTISQDGDLVLTGTITSGPQSITATGNISVVPSSPVLVSASGSQTITAGGTLTVQGGASGMGDSAQVLATGDQTINAAGLFVSGGGGNNNFAEIAAPNQNIGVSGDVTLQGGSSANAGARIGGLGGASPSATNLALNAGGNVTLTGGSSSGATIGSPASNVLGGDILITTGGNIVLNSGAAILTTGDVTLNATSPISVITQGPGSLIQADQLNIASDGVVNLNGTSQVSMLGFSGDIVLFHDGDFVISTPMKGSGDISLSATGGITVIDSRLVADGSVTVNAASLDVKGVSSGALIQAGDGFNADVNGDLRVRSASVGGGFGGWAAILAGHGPVNITAGSVALEGGKNLGGFAAITGGPVNVTTTGDFSIAGGSGLGSFGMLLSNQNIGLTVGGSLRLNSGTGFGSFARIQTLYPASTISVHFPNLESGGYFVNGTEGRISQGLTGFFTGVWPAKLGKTLITTYGEE